MTGKTPIEKASVLPQTGDKRQNWLSILGDVSLAVIIISGAMIFKRRKRD
ncbi:LPXTG cell wall anchor domain-containing protein [Lentilactobacillus buchneri]|nr:LPXTG cell wall anchor domain-containing protein [Lentilactobacillus buchneri]